MLRTHTTVAARHRSIAKSIKASMSTSIVWYKVSDLRLHDHKPLYTAHQTHDSVAHVFVFDPRWFAKTPFGFPKTGYHRTRFMREAVADLHMVSMSHLSRGTTDARAELES